MKKGISLIILVITIIVIIILAGAVILSLSQNNPINSSTEAMFKTSIDSYKSALTLYLASEYSKNLGNLDTTTIFASKTAGTYDGGKTIQQIIPSMIDTDANDFGIDKGKLVYVGTDLNKKVWAKADNLATPYLSDGLILFLEGQDFKNSPQTQYWIDRSGNNNHAIANSFTYSASSGSDGIGSVSFDGSDWFRVNKKLTTPFTVSAWIKYTDQAKTMNTMINSYPHATLVISINRSGGGQIQTFIGNGSSWLSTPVASKTMTVGTWYYVSFTSDGTGSKTYLNNELVSTSSTSPTGWGDYFEIGRIVYLSEYLKGNIYSYQIYDKALAIEQITQNYNASKTQYGF